MVEYSVICLSIVCCLLFAAGTQAPWPSPELQKLNSTDGGVFNGTLTTSQWSWIGSLGTLGCVAGSLLGGLLVEMIGRKTAMLGLALPIMLSYLILAFAKNLYLFYFARFLGGVPMGCLIIWLSVYIGEIARNEHRGIFSATFGFFVHCSHLLTYVTGPYMTVRNFNLMLAFLPIAYFPLFAIFGVESPYYYIKNGQDDKAKIVLKKLRSNASDKELSEEFQYITRLIDIKEEGSFVDIFRHKGNRKAFFILIVLLTCYNFSGLYAMLTYTQQVFEKAGSAIPASTAAIVTGVAQLAAGSAAPILISNFKRKTLLYFSTVCTAVGQAILGVYFYLESQDIELGAFKYVSLVTVIFTIVVCSLGMAQVPYVFLAEIFTSSAKGKAASICMIYSWFLSFAVVKLFPLLTDYFGSGPVFFAFSAVCLAAIPFNKFCVKETKGRTLMEILDDFNK